jgi:hypothetical protein
MSKSFKVYAGEDASPILDLTEPDNPVHIIWEEVEAGGRAFQGESTISTFPLRDEQGGTGNPDLLPDGVVLKQILAGSRVEWLAGGNRLFRGRIGPKDYSRGRQKADRAREVVMSAQDTNFDLRNIIVDGWSRPEETDVARVQALITDYLSGSPRASTVITDDYVASGSNTVTLGAKVYDATQPSEVLSEIATIADKLHFVTIDDELFYDGYDSNTYQAGIRISDRLDELDTSVVCTPGEEAGVLDAGYDAESSGNDSMSVTVDSAAGGLIVAWLTHDAITSPSAKYAHVTGADPTTMTKIATIEHPTASSGSNTDNETLHIFWLADPTTSGSGAGVTFEWGSGVPNGSAFGYWTVDSSAIPTVTTASGTGTSSSVTPTAGATDLVLDVVGWRIWSLANASNDPTATASQTEDWGIGFNNSAGQPDMAWGGAHKVGDGARTWSWTTSTNWVAAAIVIPSSESGTVATFPPIWDVGPAETEDGLELLSGLRLYYGQGSNTYVYVNDPVTANIFWHSEQSLYTNDPLINTPTRATTLANSILQHRKWERRTINVSVGPLSEAQTACLKPGQLIQIKARALPEADDQYRTRRIVQLRWTTPVPGTYFAHMMLDKPIKTQPSGVGPKQSTDSINRHVEQGSNSHPEYVLRGTLISQGDLPYRGASDWTRLAIGASNTVLKSIGTVPVWAPLPASAGTIAVEDEGSEEGAAISRLDFTGAGVSVSVSGAEATVNIPGGAGATENLFVGSLQALTGYGSPSITSALGADRGYFAKFIPAKDVTVDTAYWNCTTSSGNLCFAIYDASFNRLATTGTFASPGTGSRSQALGAAVDLDAGTVYYLAMSASSTTLRVPTLVPVALVASPWNLIGRKASSSPLPDPGTPDDFDGGITFPIFFFGP